MRPCGLSENPAFNPRVSRECHDLGQGRVTILNRLRQIGVGPPQTEFTVPLRRPTVPQPRQRRSTDDSALPSTLPSSNLPVRSTPSSCQTSCLQMWCSALRTPTRLEARGCCSIGGFALSPDQIRFQPTHPLNSHRPRRSTHHAAQNPVVFRRFCAAALACSRLKSVPQQNCMGAMHDRACRLRVSVGGQERARRYRRTVPASDLQRLLVALPVTA